MRPDQHHVRKLAQAITAGPDGAPEIKLDIPFMRQAFDRLSMWERGLMTICLLDAGRAENPTDDQRALLALFVYQGGGDDR